jgi:DNA-directed RNA polymerase subunit H (RpoH/RPB5)
MSARSNRVVVMYQRARAKLCEVFEQNLGYDVGDYAGASLADVHIMREANALDMRLDRKWAAAPGGATAEEDEGGEGGGADKGGEGGGAPAAAARASEPATSRVYVHFAAGRPNAKSMHAALRTIFEEQGLSRADTLVLVLPPDKPGKIVVGGSKAVRAALDEIWWLQGYHVVVHDLEHLQYNALQHEEQPMGLRVLSPADRDAFLAETGTQLNELPKMSRADPVAALLCARVGDVVYGERSSPTTVLAPVWRVVTADPFGPKSSSKGGGAATAAAAEKAAGHA